MKACIRPIPAGLGLGLVLAASVTAAAYRCPGRTAEYLTDCTPAGSTGQPCIRRVPDSGCCFAGLGFCSVDACFVPARATQNACNDGNQCTIDVCTTNGSSLDPICTYPRSPDGAECDLDENLCTVDRCDQGTCRHSSRDVWCGQCQECNTKNGRCENVPTLAMKACDDGKDCTTGDVCVNGVCSRTGVQAKGYVCADGDPCKPGTCNGSDEVCRNRRNASDTTTCATPSRAPSTSVSTRHTATRAP
jgi:hypothetical protein